MILAGDIGGTNTRLAIFEADGKRLKQIAMDVYPSNDYQSLKEIVVKFMEQQSGQVEGACFGIAGPIKDGKATTSNLSWVVDSQVLAAELKVEQVQLINDLEANAYGIAGLEPGDFVTLQEGNHDPVGNAALISAGTGLGEAGLFWDGQCLKPFASEGGHADFAPRNELEMEMLSFLLKSCEHVSYERFLSGPGLANIYDFLVKTGREEEPSWLRDEMAKHNRSVTISKNGLSGSADVCVTALEMFVSIYASEAANLALKLLATGGVFLGGGIAPKIIEKLKEPAFLDSFYAKGRMAPILHDIPVKVIMADQTALLGAGRVASSMSACEVTPPL